MGLKENEYERGFQVERCTLRVSFSTKFRKSTNAWDAALFSQYSHNVCITTQHSNNEPIYKTGLIKIPLLAIVVKTPCTFLQCCLLC